MPVALIRGQQEPVDRLGETRLPVLAGHKKCRGELVRSRHVRRDGERESGQRAPDDVLSHILAPLSRSELSTTEIDEALMAKAANIGLIRMPKTGNRTPAATGTPEAL